MRIRDGPAAVWEYETGRFQNQCEIANPHAKEPEVGRAPSQKNCKNTGPHDASVHLGKPKFSVKRRAKEEERCERHLGP